MGVERTVTITQERYEELLKTEAEHHMCRGLIEKKVSYASDDVRAIMGLRTEKEEKAVERNVKDARAD